MKPGNVYSFEPSVFNLRQLAKNISLNALTDRIVIVSTPLSDKTGIAQFKNGNVDEGGALSAFGVDFGFDGKPIKSDVSYNLIGFSLDDFLKIGVVSESPSLLKIDVDGIEHLILAGATKTLLADSLKSIYIEVNDNFFEQSSQVSKILSKAGFTLKEKRQSDHEKISEDFKETYNQIWIK